MHNERSSLLRLLPSRLLFLLALVTAAAATLFGGTSTASAANVTCTGPMSGGPSGPLNIDGNVIVPQGANCTLSFVNVTGNVQADKGSTLLIDGYTEPSTIGGNVQANNCYSALLQGNVTVKGNVEIQQCSGNGPNGFQGPDIVINGNFHCQGNSSNAASCMAWLGKVQGNVQIQQNRGQTAPDVSLVAVGGNLICQQNSSAPTHVHGPSWVDGNSIGQCQGFSTTSTSISNGPVSPAGSCGALANLPASGFPVPNTVITSAVDTPASGNLPERCIVNGYVNQRVSPVDNCTYQNGFQIQLPLPTAWNGRFMFQGGGGTEGSVPTATGTNTGGAGANFGIINGYAVASQDGGHENSLLRAATCDSGYGNANQFFLDPLAYIGWGYQSMEVTTLVAKYLVNQYYGSGPDRSYSVGCSTGGRQGMALSQNFPQFYDGIVAGDPVYDLEAQHTIESWGVQQFLNLYQSTPGLPAISYVAAPAPQAPEPILYPAFPTSDQTLFQTTLLQFCDALDGVADGMIDNVLACQAKFDPATATYTDYTGVLGPANQSYALQCTGAKNATCLTPAQIQTAKNINRGVRTSSGMTVQAPAGAVAPDHADNTLQGALYDGNFMASTGIGNVMGGTATRPPAYYPAGLTQFVYGFISPPSPTKDPLSFNVDTDLNLLRPTSPVVGTSTSLDISKFVNYGHKMIWYHGQSDVGVPILGTINYYTEMAAQHGGLDAAQSFSRLYPVPNMGHCGGGASTDQFDLLTPMAKWVEQGTAPDRVPATGVNFNATIYQALGNYITGGFINAPTTRSRPLCPYPQQARFTGSAKIVSGVSVATNPADLANASNYTCVQPTP